MTNDLNTLLTALYVNLQDRVLPLLGWSRGHRPGRKPRLSDAELVRLAVAQQLLSPDPGRPLRVTADTSFSRWADR